MWPFTAREQPPIPEEAQKLLDRIPARFLDDGCTHSPDVIFGFDLRWACRIHDWSGCTRCHPPGSRTLQEMWQANAQLKRFIGQALPWRWGWIKHVYYRSVARFNGDYSWDSCGFFPQGGSANQLRDDLCRHNMPRPGWMRDGYE